MGASRVLQIVLGATRFVDGAVGAPGVSWISDTDSGFYRIGANNLGISVGGTKVIDIGAATIAITGNLTVSGSFTPSGVLLGPNGTAGAPTYSFASDTDLGMFRIGADNLRFTVGGTTRFHIVSTAFESTVVGFLPNGSNTAPSYSFSSDTDSGMYFEASSGVAIAHDGQRIMSIRQALTQD